MSNASRLKAIAVVLHRLYHFRSPEQDSSGGFFLWGVTNGQRSKIVHPYSFKRIVMRLQNGRRIQTADAGAGRIV